MGINGLWNVLEPSAKPITLEMLEGKRLAVDISIWLHQAAAAAHDYTDYQLNSKNPHLSLILRRLAKLLFYRIRPFFVFDGANVPIFKRKLLRDRQVKRYIEELTMTKAQKRALVQFASSQFGGDEHSVDELRSAFSSQLKKRRDDTDGADLFDAAQPSTSKECIVVTNAFGDDGSDLLQSPSQESSRSSAFEQAEFESLATRDERVDYLLAERDRVRSGLRLKEIPDDSKAFSNLQIERLLKRNRINEQLQLVKNEALAQNMFSMAGERRSYSSGNIRLATMEGLDRVHIISDDSNDVQIINENEEIKKRRVVDPIAGSAFLQNVKGGEGIRNTEKVVSEDGKTEASSDESDSDDVSNVALQKAIHASVSDSFTRNSVVSVKGHCNESKGDVIERLRLAFAERARDLQHDNWSPSSSISSESGDEFVEVPELPKDIFGFCNPSKVSDAFTPGKQLNDERLQHVDEKGKDVNETHQGAVLQGPSMRNNPADEHMDIFASAREAGTYKDCQELLRICGIPFIVAPGEAEAQCCELERLGLVHGIISDDSDVWLFGSSVVYKNMFNQKRRLQMFSKEAIQNQLGLSRWEEIQIALLSGGDYTNGLEGVGVVSALELISEFSTASRQVDAEPAEESSSIGERSMGKFVENTRRLKLRRIIEKNNAAETLETFPSRKVFDAYAMPAVDSSTEKPKWRTINMDELERFVWEKLGWDLKQLEQQTNKALLKWNEYLNPAAGGSGVSYQMHITSFAHSLHKCEEDQRLAPTARVQAALNRLITIKSFQNSQGLSEGTKGDVEIAKQSKRTKIAEKAKIKKTRRSKKERSNASKEKGKKENGKKVIASGKELRLSEESSSDENTD